MQNGSWYFLERRIGNEITQSFPFDLSYHFHGLRVPHRGMAALSQFGCWCNDHEEATRPPVDFTGASEADRKTRISR